MATVTCHTNGCGNEGDAIEMPLVVELDGEEFPVDIVTCGVCGQEITDIDNDERAEATPK